MANLLKEAAERFSGYLHVSVCCIYDGNNYHTGLSTGFEIPPQILELILHKKMDLSQACLHSGISNNTEIGSTEGLIGVLSKGKIDRKEYSKQCVIAAVLQLENYQWYVPSKVITKPKISLESESKARRLHMLVYYLQRLRNADKLVSLPSFGVGRSLLQKMPTSICYA